MFDRSAAICLITQSLICLTGIAAFAISAQAVPIQGHAEKHAPQVIPVPPELFGYRIIVPLVLSDSLDSKNLRAGDVVHAVLKDDFRIAGKRYAPKGARVDGHVVSYTAPRTLSKAISSSDRRLNSRAMLQIQFDDIVGADGAHIPIVGVMSQQSVIVPGQHSPDREIKVDTQGRIIKGEQILSTGERRVSNTARVFTMAPLPGGIILNVAGAPVVMGIAGAIDPNVAYNKPVDPKIRHRRLKGMIYGFVTNLPGAVLVTSFVEKGSEIVLNAGDELTVDVRLTREKPFHNAAPLTIADVQGTILSANMGGAPIPGGSVPEEGLPAASDGLVAQSGKFDDSLDLQSASQATALINPGNGGKRLLPSGPLDAPRNGGVRLIPSGYGKTP